MSGSTPPSRACRQPSGGRSHPACPTRPGSSSSTSGSARRDILEFCRDPGYRKRRWPDDYWPASPSRPDPEAWDASVAEVRRDREALQALAIDPAVDLLAKIPHGTGQTYLRELLLVADHTAYHLGQLVVVRRLLGSWNEAGAARTGVRNIGDPSWCGIGSQGIPAGTYFHVDLKGVSDATHWLWGLLLALGALWLPRFPTSGAISRSRGCNLES